MGGKGSESALSYSRTVELKPLAVFVTETKVVKKTQDPRGNCWSFGESWLEEQLLSKYRSPGRALVPSLGPSGSQDRAPGISPWKSEARSRGVCFWTDGTKQIHGANLLDTSRVNWFYLQMKV